MGLGQTAREKMAAAKERGARASGIKNAGIKPWALKKAL